MKAIDELIAYVKEHNPTLYYKVRAEDHERECGRHFDEDFGTEAVEYMYHIEDGKKVSGEHWTIDQVREAIEPYKDRMKTHDTIWDAYVALNMFYHDMVENYKKRSSNYDAWVIDDAMLWAFGDDDAPEGKIWLYICAIMGA